MSPTAPDDVREAHARWWNALLDSDVASLEALLADDLTFHSPGGRAGSKASYLEGLRSGRLAYDSITAPEPVIRVHGAAAIVTGRADIQFQSQGQPRTEGLHYTAVYSWTAPHWRMRAWQSTHREEARG
jgi:ketosteroid isomerase-like protein